MKAIVAKKPDEAEVLNIIETKEPKIQKGVDPKRLEAFSDGVIAIIITIMVLEIHAPDGHSLSDWQENISVVLAYLFSFIMLAIYWNNHHHLLRATRHITPLVMWANMSLLFFLSLIPVTTAWVGKDENYLHAWPIAMYAAVGLLSALSFFVLSRSILRADPKNSKVLLQSKSLKGKISPLLYLLAIIMAFIYPVIAIIVMIVIALLWFIPDNKLAD